MPSLRAQVGPLALDGPAMLASGVLGISAEVFERVRAAGASAVVTKSVSARPRDGYPNPTFAGVRGGGWVNAVGLSNPGAAGMAAVLSACPGVPAVASLVGSEPAEFAAMARELAPARPAAYELNLSCPHVERVGLEVGDDAELVSRIVRATRAAARAPVIAKVGLGSSDYLETVRAAAGAGADAVTAINTVRAMSVDVESQRPVLSNRVGGLSGPPIRPVAVRCVYEIASRAGVPVIGCGGVSGWEDAAEMLLAGASAVQVGSAVASGGWLGVFAEINSGLEAYMGRKGLRSLGEMTGLALR